MDKESAVAVEIQLNETMLPHDESAEEALERALVAWQAARSRIETVDPTQLSAAGRASYFRLLVKIGLWSDARVEGAPIGRDEPIEHDDAEDEESAAEQ